MHLAPFASVALRSPLPPAELAAALRPLIGPPGAPFAGSVDGGGFVVTRVNGYHGSFRPVARGAFRPAAAGTEVLLRLRPHGQVFAFMGIWLLFLAGFAAIVLVARAHDPSRSLLPLLAPGGLALLSWHLTAGVFAAEARWTVEQLLGQAGEELLSPKGHL